VNSVHLADAFSVIQSLPEESIDLVYTDPPFGTGTVQRAQRRVGDQVFPEMGYSDRFEDYVGFLVPHLAALHRVLKPTGTLYLHLDPRWVHYAKVELDKIFTRDNFLNEVIWAYDFGGRGKDRWPAKHDTILVYAKERGKHVFNWNDIDRIPYMAPGLQKDPARAAAGKVPTDVWWMSIVGTASKERTGYPNQKPVKLIERAILASSPPEGTVLDPFCGSGTTAVASAGLGRQFVVGDANPQAIAITKARLDALSVHYICT
jgi:site-specific DNA-methyltransferase (adenine-specific)